MLSRPARSSRLIGTYVLLATLGACHRGPREGMVAPTVSTPGANAAVVAACDMPVATATGSLAATPIPNPLTTFDSAWAIVARTHWDTTYNGVNWRGVRDELRPKAERAKTTGELRAVLSDMVGRLRQSHFSIIPREISDATTAASSQTSDHSGTTGAALRLLDGAMVVSQVPATSAAARAGVKAGWRLDLVNGCPIAPRLARLAELEPRRASLTAYSLASQMLAGRVGDTVRATFRDGDGKAHSVAIVRQKEPGTLAKFGNLPPIPSSLTFERVRRDGKTIGIIHFNIWMPVLSAQFDAAIDSLRGSDGIILDVRGNFGGVGGMSMGVAGHFLDSSQTIGTMHQRGAALKFVANPRMVDTRLQRVKPFAGPLAIVVDELSISTTEIFAAGMKELGRARIIGSQTAGQALPSVPERLPNGDILYHAIADFTSPTGKSIEGPGVVPDENAPLTVKALLSGKDPARDAALAWIVQASKTVPKGATP